MIEFTDNDVNRFLSGDCHILARALHRVTGWPLCAFVDRDNIVPNLHAFVATPSNKYLDVLGLHEYQPFIDQWEKDNQCFPGISLSIYEFEWDNFVGAGWKAQYGKYSYLRAWEIAPKLVAKHLASC